MSSILETKLKQVFDSALNLPAETQYDKLEFAKSKGWDSIAHLQLIAAIEKEFNLMIETNDMLAMSSYNIAIQILKKYDPNLT